MPSISAASGALSSGRTKARAALCPVACPVIRSGFVADRGAHGQRAAHRAQVAGERQFAGEFVGIEPAALIWPEATRMPSAMGRSKRPDSLGRSAGARLTVMRRCGNSKPQFWIAARTRSRASLTSVSGRPTRVKEGKPAARWTSTVTSGAARPASARERRTASDIGGGVKNRAPGRAGISGCGLPVPRRALPAPRAFPGCGRALRAARRILRGSPGPAWRTAPASAARRFFSTRRPASTASRDETRADISSSSLGFSMAFGYLDFNDKSLAQRFPGPGGRRACTMAVRCRVFLAWFGAGAMLRRMVRAT
jgi:hypothetical protein